MKLSRFHLNVKVQQNPPFHFELNSKSHDTLHNNIFLSCGMISVKILDNHKKKLCIPQYFDYSARLKVTNIVESAKKYC